MNTKLIMSKFALYQSVLTAYLQNDDLKTEMSKNLLLCYMFAVLFVVSRKDEDFRSKYIGYVNKTNSEDADHSLIAFVVGLLKNVFVTSQSLSAEGFIQRADNGKLKLSYEDMEIGEVFSKYIIGGIPFGSKEHGFNGVEYNFIVKGLRAAAFLNEEEISDKVNIDKFQEPYEFAIDLHKDLKLVSESSL